MAVTAVMAICFASVALLGTWGAVQNVPQWTGTMPHKTGAASGVAQAEAGHTGRPQAHVGGARGDARQQRHRFHPRLTQQTIADPDRGEPAGLVGHLRHAQHLLRRPPLHQHQAVADVQGGARELEDGRVVER